MYFQNVSSVYLQHSKNNPNDINSQIQTLNALVLDYAVGQVYGEIQGYINYKIDASTMYKNISSNLYYNPELHLFHRQPQKLHL